MEGAIFDAFIERCAEMKDIEGIVDTFDPCPTIVVSPVQPEEPITETEPPIIDEGGVEPPNSGDRGTTTDNSTDVVAPVVAATQESSSNDRKVSGAGIFGIIMLFLVLFALLALFIRRRRRNYERRRTAKLDQNDTFMIDDGNNGAGSPGRFSDGDDSMIDSRYGMYPEGKSEGMILGSRNVSQDVHKCSSATCNLCEARRNGSISFLPASKGILGIRPLHQLNETPTTARAAVDERTSARTYEVGNTVLL
jgi:hypothetical protein